MNFRGTVFFIIGLFIGVILHEYMHARIADWRGDQTPRRAGRLTLNPIPHIDPFGTVLVPLILLFLTQGHWLFGYAKPVPINPYFMKNPKRDMVLVALAGPLTNFSIAFILALIGMFIRLFGADPAGGLRYFFDFLYAAAQINVILGFFNLIPVPPLDGSHVLEYFLPPNAQRAYEAIAPYGFIIIIGFLLLLGNYFFSWMNPVFNLIGKITYGV
ncbi:MAG: site-2 protease family protein [Actinobacteria bacterium]|nr:site-2 protease family protein [Actinomycetota bacterium]